MPYTIVWEYRVPADDRSAFEAAYGADGAWAALFARADGFLGVELLRSVDGDGHYLTFDRWATREAYEAFAAAHAMEYRQLDERLARRAGVQHRIGAFSSSSPDPL